MNYQGVIIEESLNNPSILKEVKILETRVERVTAHHQTPWLKIWTLHTVEIPEEKIEVFSEKISKVIGRKQSWYADFKNDTYHYIIFKNKIFKINRKSKEEYEKATNYGISLGIPAHQLDYSPEVN